MNQKAKNFSLVFLIIAAVVFGAYLLNYQKTFLVVQDNKSAISDDRVTFLLLGKTGKVIGWNMSPDLTDTIILVDYRPKIGALNLISLPRDLFVNVDGENFKLNEVAKRNKIPDFLKQLPQITGLDTDKYMVIDLDLLKSAVDDLGGIDVKLNSAAVDWASGYKIEAGEQHLDGEQAAWLVRNRYAPNGDFYRENNQHEVIQALMDKFRGLNALDKARFIFNMTPELGKLETNVNFQEFVPLIQDIKNPRFNNVVLDFSTGLVMSSSTPVSVSSSQYILLPTAGEGNYLNIKTYIQSKLEK